MSNPYDDILASDAAIFIDPALMPGVETITYEGEDGVAVPITAQVFRGVPVESGVGVSLAIRIVVSRSLVPAVNESMDKFTLAKAVGGEPEAMTVAQIVTQDAGMYELELE